MVWRARERAQTHEGVGNERGTGWVGGRGLDGGGVGGSVQIQPRESVALVVGVSPEG